ncbi:MAG: VWA domain-containing protein [Ruminococcaceae bacterium]|nr:VWA domain-containing protein [Oscillospiraceae bacterium]
MSIYENLSAGDFAKTTRKRLPICFCLDASGSMEAPTASGKTRMQELNEAFEKFIRTMKSNDDVNSSADIAIITFGGQPYISKPFGPISDYYYSRINTVPRSFTPLGEAIQVALKLFEIRKIAYREKGIKYFQPWLVVITDGEPEGAEALENMNIAIQQTVELERNNKLVVFNIGIGSDANLAMLQRLSVKRDAPIKVDETNLDELFSFLSSSSESIIGGENQDILYGANELPTGTEINLDSWI